jgi:hypothetical protein
MSVRLIPFIFISLLLLIIGCKDKGSGPGPDVFQLLKVSANEQTLNSNRLNSGLSTQVLFSLEFTAALDTASVKKSILLIEEGDTEADLSFTFENETKDIVLTTATPLNWNTKYELQITDGLSSVQGADFPGVSFEIETENGQLELISASINNKDITENEIVRGITYNEAVASFEFSEALDEQTFQNHFSFSPSVQTEISISEDGKTVTITNIEELDYYRNYTTRISDNLQSERGFEFEGFSGAFQTGLDSTYKFPQISDSELLTKVQEETFGYFWDFGHPVSGLARERNTSSETVTIGGSGFGVMAIIVGVHRGFITREEGISRLQKNIDFLTNADRFHGVWPHWMNGSTGDVIPFSTYDNGGDLVETAFMAQGLITVRQFLDENITAENELISDINNLLDTIEWDWYTRGGQNVLYWHWSPEHNWRMNMQIKGYNEGLIVYLMAATSGDYGIQPEVYHEGWASSGGIENGNTFYGINLPVGYDFGGPLFFAHYSFLGLNPENLSDRYADYWTQNRNHTLINQQHSIVNPNGFVGYSESSWGLTASDNPDGYLAQEPTRDNGTITPTAAVSSIPYTPEKSMDAIRHFYYILGDKLWGEYGFHDAFNPTRGWWADSYLAIDQGPIIIMIENHRSGLLWDLFMSAPEVQTALEELDFSVTE